MESNSITKELLYAHDFADLCDDSKTIKVIKSFENDLSIKSIVCEKNDDNTWYICIYKENNIGNFIISTISQFNKIMEIFDCDFRLDNMFIGADKYYKKLNGSKVICVDFDNTICLDEWPYIGPFIFGAKEVLQKLQNRGHKLILYTQRTQNYPICCKELKEYDKKFEYSKFLNRVDILRPAIDICKKNGIRFDDVNQNKEWELLTRDFSRKVFMDYLIDDHVIGIEKLTITNKFGEDCKIVNWYKIDEWCVNEGLYENNAIDCSYEEYLYNLYKNFIKK